MRIGELGGKRVGTWEVASGYGGAGLLAERVKGFARAPWTRAFAEHFRGDDGPRRLQAWVQRNVRFVREDGEIFRAPWITVDTGYGDCDDHATLVASVLGALGWRVAFGFVERDGEPTHVWAKVHDGRRWVDLETTVAAAYGEEPERAVRRLALNRVDVTMGQLAQLDSMGWHTVAAPGALHVEGGQRVWMRLLASSGITLADVEAILVTHGFADVAVYPAGADVATCEAAPPEWCPDPLQRFRATEKTERVVRAVATYAQPESRVFMPRLDADRAPFPLAAEAPRGAWVAVLAAWSKDAPAVAAMGALEAPPAELEAARRATSWVPDATLRRHIAFFTSIGADPFDGAAVIAYESGWKPWARNPSSGATGLIQWVEQFAPVPTARLATMGVEEQYAFVEQWFRGKRPGRWSPAVVYLAVFNPGRIGPNTTDDTILYARGTPAYEQNRSLDADNDGKIEVGDLGAIVERTRGTPTYKAIALRMRELGASPGGGGGGGALVGAALVATGAGLVWAATRGMFG